MAKISHEALEEATPDASEENPGYLGTGFSALHDVRDRTLLLSLGNAFLCEEAFLKKIGSAIESQLGNLRQEILDLKTRYPGKFATEINTDSILEDLRAHARELQNPHKGVIDKCTVGTLGRGMEDTLDALTVAVRRLKRKVEGETPSYTSKDSLLVLIGKAGRSASLLKRLTLISMKTVLVLILLSIGPLIYLIVSMDREGALLKDIAVSEAAIKFQRETVASADRERDAIWKRIEVMKTDDASRETRFTIMEMSVRAHSLEQNRHSAEAEISAHEEKIRINKEKLREIREKAFLDRLLRK
ncbi:MAG: hypothetical protein JW836_10835 [Deltaproteobacteria bacterium]|nr:hypothetical protein [Deltaproteobacteria bacterium]